MTRANTKYLAGSSKGRRRSAAGHAHSSPQERRVKHPGLVRDLTARFGRDLDAPELPLLSVNRIPQSRTVHLLVIWDAWADIDVHQRGRVITDAFVAVHPDERGSVTLPMGLTPSEALSMGYLRYQIIPLVRQSDKISAQAVDKALRAAGGVLVRVGGGKHLRFATRRQAEQAYRTLLSHINAPIWTLAEDGASASESA